MRMRSVAWIFLLIFMSVLSSYLVFQYDYIDREAGYGKRGEKRNRAQLDQSSGHRLKMGEEAEVS